MPQFENMPPNIREKVSDQQESKVSGRKAPIGHEADSLPDSRIAQDELSDAHNSLKRIGELENVLGPLPDARGHNTTVINTSEAAVTQAQAGQPLETTSGAKQAESDPKKTHQEKAAREISLHERIMMRRAEDMTNSLYSIEKSITEDYNFSRSILKVGRVIERWGSITEIKKHARMLAEDFFSLNKEHDANQKLIMAQRNLTKIRALAKKMDDFHFAISSLQSKVSNYYEGRSNDDEDMLRRLQQQLRVSFEALKNINMMCKNEESMLTDYGKLSSNQDKI